ncbi:MAG TPA: hypothetical protein PLK30_09650 [Blastocatellia bacterium]|nr:hypothetical protein [Blastocatellia bacterium]
MKNVATGAHRLLTKSAMITQSPTNQVPSVTGGHGHHISPIKEILRQWLHNPLTFVFLVWGILFVGFGLLLFLLP